MEFGTRVLDVRTDQLLSWLEQRLGFQAMVAWDRDVGCLRLNEDVRVYAGSTPCSVWMWWGPGRESTSAHWIDSERRWQIFVNTNPI